VEALNLKPRLVVGSRENLKVTYAEDLPIAASILERRV
jgi:2-C-methyl-D-erythritol 4-phosphate cytidylyltransferase